MTSFEVKRHGGVGNAETRSTDGETRRQIMQVLLQEGPITANNVAESLGLSATGIRRHLDVLLHDGFAELAPMRRSASDKSRGRPAKAFRLTDKGRAQFGHNYDALAVAALQTLRETGGDDAVMAFARARANKIIASIDIDKQALDDKNPVAMQDAARKVVDAFSENGYAATVNDNSAGVQICQHHCPISGVASQFPELCEAEHEAIADLLGQHVQLLASIADGHGICTTNIPITPIYRKNQQSSQERSGS